VRSPVGSIKHRFHHFGHQPMQCVYNQALVLCRKYLLNPRRCPQYAVSGILQRRARWPGLCLRRRPACPPALAGEYVGVSADVGIGLVPAQTFSLAPTAPSRSSRFRFRFGRTERRGGCPSLKLRWR
jgi:hypothetical protein